MLRAPRSPSSSSTSEEGDDAADARPAPPARPGGVADPADGAGAQLRARLGRAPVQARRARRRRVLPGPFRDGRPRARQEPRSATALTHDEQLQWEARAGRPAAAAAIASAAPGLLRPVSRTPAPRA